MKFNPIVGKGMMFLCLSIAVHPIHSQEVDSIPTVPDPIELSQIDAEGERLALNLKTQFPIQHGFGVELITRNGLAFGIGIGQLSRAYTVTATNFLAAEDEAEEKRKDFIRDKMENGFVFELSSFYYLKNFRNFYVGANLQIQRFQLPATAQEFVENYGFATDEIFSEIQELTEDNEVIRAFYEETIIEATVKPIQLGFTVGKRFDFNRVKGLSLLTELSYHLNLNTRTTLDSPSLVGSIIVNSFIEPNLDPNTAESFGGFNLPSLAVRLQYQFDTIKSSE